MRVAGSKERAPPDGREGEAGDGNVKILLPETELQGFAGRGEQREAGGCPAGHTPGLAQEYVQEKNAFLYTIMYYHTNAVKNT